GESAFRAAQSAREPNMKRKLEKEAYIYFKRAVQKNPQRVSPRLRSRFIEATLTRAEMVLNEGSASMDAIPLLTADIDSNLTADVDQGIRDRYATFLSALADSSFSKRKLYNGLRTLDKAINIAGNKGPLEQLKQQKIGNFAKENFETAEVEMVNGQTNNDPESLIRAEFYILLAMHYNPNYTGAKEMLSKLRKLNQGTYSAYDAVVFDKPDSAIFRAVNRWDILFAVPKIVDKGGSAYLEASMYNYSYNPLRMKAQFFSIVDANGRRYQAFPNTTFDKDILEQKLEIKLRMNFPKSSAPIKKLVFETDDKEHYAEKEFF
ncbi:MAG: hypothetical protein JW795_15425, partial [Chitinivibrionales bacterium]|nr:hypothetical protein [Chitinivibrionales bacterium]